MVFGIVGVVTLLSAVLAWLWSPWWLVLTALMGLNMIQASVTGFCPAALVAKKLGVKPGCVFE